LWGLQVELAKEFDSRKVYLFLGPREIYRKCALTQPKIMGYH